MTDWKPVNLCTDDCKSRDSYCPPRNRFGCASYERYQGEIDAQRKLLEYLLTQTLRVDTDRGYLHIIDPAEVEEMLKELEEK